MKGLHACTQAKSLTYACTHQTSITDQVKTSCPMSSIFFLWIDRSVRLVKERPRSKVRGYIKVLVWCLFLLSISFLSLFVCIVLLDTNIYKIENLIKTFSIAICFLFPCWTLAPSADPNQYTCQHLPDHLKLHILGSWIRE